MRRFGFFLSICLAIPAAADPRPNHSLQEAILSGDLPRAQSAIMAGADLTHRDYLGRTPLIQACAFSSAPMVRLIAKKNFYAIDLGDGAGQTPLMLACVYGNLSAVKVLLELKAEVHKTSRYGATALSLAQKYARDEIQALLLSADAVK
jgi:hypothetical protein